MYPTGFGISLSEFWLQIAFLLIPLWACIGVGCVAEWFFFPRLLFMVGGYLGFWVGLPPMGLMIWEAATWYDIEHLAVPMSTSVACGAVATIGACWFFKRCRGIDTGAGE